MARAEEQGLHLFTQPAFQGFQQRFRFSLTFSKPLLCRHSPYQTRYEWLHESYQKWLTGFTRHAVSWGVCHPNIYYFHNLTPGWVSFNGEKPEIAIVPQSLHRLIYGPDKRATPPLDDDLIVNLCTSEHLLVHHPMLEGILLSECERLRQRSLANKLISLFRQFGGTELHLKLVWLCWLDLMTGNSLEDWKENLKRKSEKGKRRLSTVWQILKFLRE